jgi:VanZ family protein
MKRFIWLWLPVVVWCGLIFWLSSIPNLRVSNQALTDLLLRKTAHIGEYAILTIMVFRAMGGNYDEWRWPWAGWAFSLTLFYSMSDEWHQHFVNGRHGSPYDVLIDMVGIVIGLLLVGWFGWWSAALASTKNPVK